MKLGFTGARFDPLPEQELALLARLVALRPAELRHGACRGADELAVRLARANARHCTVIAHPPADDKLVSGLALLGSHIRLRPKDYLLRNRDIVEACDVLLACPRGPEDLRSGTWSTIRWGKKLGRRVVIVWPSGEVTEEEPIRIRAGT